MVHAGVYGESVSYTARSDSNFRFSVSSVIVFQLDFSFGRKQSRLRLRFWEIKRCGKCNTRNPSSLEICPRAPCAGHSTKHQS